MVSEFSVDYKIIDNLLAEIEALKDIARTILLSNTYKEFSKNFTDILINNGWKLGDSGDLHIINSRFRAKIFFNKRLTKFNLVIETPTIGVKEYKFNIYLDGKSKRSKRSING